MDFIIVGIGILLFIVVTVINISNYSKMPNRMIIHARATDLNSFKRGGSVLKKGSDLNNELYGNKFAPKKVVLSAVPIIYIIFIILATIIKFPLIINCIIYAVLFFINILLIVLNKKLVN